MGCDSAMGWMGLASWRWTRKSWWGWPQRRIKIWATVAVQPPVHAPVVNVIKTIRGFCRLAFACELKREAHIHPLALQTLNLQMPLFARCAAYQWPTWRLRR